MKKSIYELLIKLNQKGTVFKFLMFSVPDGTREGFVRECDKRGRGGC